MLDVVGDDSDHYHICITMCVNINYIYIYIHNIYIYIYVIHTYLGVRVLDAVGDDPDYDRVVHEAARLHDGLSCNVIYLQ